jgi:hypothetical protein
MGRSPQTAPNLFILISEDNRVCEEGRNLEAEVIETRTLYVCTTNLLTIVNGCGPFTSSEKFGGVFWADCLSWEVRVDFNS